MLHELGVVSAAKQIASGQLSARELAEALLKRAEEFVQLNAFVTLNGERIRAEAQAADAMQASGAELGPLHGVPIALKDNIETRDDPTTAGSNVLRGFMAKEDAPVVARLKAAGAIAFGKTGMHEFAFGVTSNNAAFGAVRNPFGPTYSAGGSSGGSGAAVGGRLVTAAIGTDTGGSVRIPAAWCGIFGLRPTVGTLARRRHHSDGAFARYAGADGALDARPRAHRPGRNGRGPHAASSLKGKRIGVPDVYYAGLDPAVATLNTMARSRLNGAGAQIVEISLPGVWDKARATQPMVLSEAREEMAAWFAKHVGRSLREVSADIASPDVAAIFRALAAEPFAISLDAYRAAREHARPAMTKLFTDALQSAQLDAIAYPTTQARAPLVGEDEHFVLNGRKVPAFETIIRNTDASSAAGLPALNVPVGRDDNLIPVGMEIVMAPGEDRALIALGLAMQAAGFDASVLDWRARPPV